MGKLSELVQDLALTGCRIGRLRFHKKIGHSQFPVWEGEEDLGSRTRKVAIKVLALATDDRGKDVLEKLFRSEVDALTQLSGHKAIIQFYGLETVVMHVDVDKLYPYESEDAAKSYGVNPSDIIRTRLQCLILEFIEDGHAGEQTYIDYAQKNPHKACEHLGEVADGLRKILETQGHRDVKPANLLWSKKDDALKIIDLGLAKPVASAGSQSSVSGTPEYLAPEEFDQNSHSPEARDVYAFSMTAYQILAAGKLPLEVSSQSGNRALKWQKAHRQQDRPDLKWHCPWMTWELNKLLKMGMDVNPENRPKMSEMRDAFRQESHWITTRSKPTNTPVAPTVDLQFSLAFTAPQSYFTTSNLIVNPRFRIDSLGQHCYWIELHMERKGSDKVYRLHQLLKDNIGPYYQMHLAYGEWGFVISFWSPAARDLSGLWQGINGLADKARILRCKDCIVIDKNGKQTPELKRGTKIQPLRITFDSLRDLYESQYIDWSKSKTLLENRVLLNWLPKRHAIYGITYIIPEASQLNDGIAKKAQLILMPEIVKAVKESPELLGAVYYRRASDDLPILPDRVEASVSVGSVLFMCSNFEAAYRIPQAILQSNEYRPDTKLFTGWYTMWHDGVTWDELVDSPTENSPKGYFFNNVGHS